MRINSWIKEDLLQLMAEFCYKYRLSRSDLIDKAVREYIKNREKEEVEVEK